MTGGSALLFQSQRRQKGGGVCAGWTLRITARVWSGSGRTKPRPPGGVFHWGSRRCSCNARS